MKDILNRMLNHEELSREEMKNILIGITQSEYPNEQITALLTALQMRGVTVDELLGFRDGILETGVPAILNADRYIDVVGTGGDRKNTFNISTTACFVIAGAGYKVAKHGNYAATSVSGASNVIQHHGIKFTDDLDKIPASESGITLRRTYQHEGPLKVGDRVKVRIDITCDRAMDYLELIDGRPSCVEPVSTRAGWRWSNGLGYYVTVNSTDTRCYVEHIDKGKYYFEYEVYVTNPGSFMTGVATMQCMYAPEFRATAPAQTLVVEP